MRRRCETDPAQNRTAQGPDGPKVRLLREVVGGVAVAGVGTEPPDVGLAGLDGQLTDLETASLEAHLATCADCDHRDEQMAGLHRLVRLRPSEAVPDLGERILAAANPPRPGHGEWIRSSLLVVGLPALFGDSAGATVHASRHLGTLAFAFAIGFVYAAWKPVRAFGLLPLAGALAVGLTITSILDLVEGHANARGEAHHVLDVAGLLLLWALAGMPRPTGWRPASRHEHEVRSRRALRAAASRRAEGDTLSDVG